jgi:hypothetical protein
MGISRKRKRRIVVGGQEYLWYVAEDDEHPFLPCSPSITVATADRQFLVRFPLGQPADYAHLVVLGPRFRSASGLGGPWRRFRCPRFDEGTAVTPSMVEALIAWCETDAAPLCEVDWRGESLHGATGAA